MLGDREGADYLKWSKSHQPMEEGRNNLGYEVWKTARVLAGISVDALKNNITKHNNANVGWNIGLKVKICFSICELRQAKNRCFPSSSSFSLW